MILVSGITHLLYGTYMQCVRPLDLDIFGDDILSVEMDIKIATSFLLFFF